MMTDALKGQIADRLIQLAHDNVKAGGRPFACIIANTETGEVLAEACNRVAQTGDPTRHAEIEAINIASAKLKAANVPVDGTNGAIGEDYKGYTMFILTDPCAMCSAAMYYCGPDEVVYLTTRGDYSKFYRDDRRHFTMETLYSELTTPHSEKTMPFHQFPPASDKALDVYKAWKAHNVPAKE
jgi:tRNA(Arg) A34 adenosine deaminase TadA